ncbi:MAG TPA: four helix bundle protein [Phycisphaerales bacterium]|nr:four helix bundle protein [Phycisphaerales bacterium]
MVSRLKPEIVARAEEFSDRMLDVVDALEKKRVYARIIDQMVGCGTSVGANVCEADQAMSANDFCKALGVSVKELGECGYWLRLCVRRKWIPASRLTKLQDEGVQLLKIFGTMIKRTRAKNRKR